jgi:hypothetical protein
MWGAKRRTFRTISIITQLKLHSKISSPLANASASSFWFSESFKNLDRTSSSPSLKSYSLLILNYTFQIWNFSLLSLAFSSSSINNLFTLLSTSHLSCPYAFIQSTYLFKANSSETWIQFSLWIIIPAYLLRDIANELKEENSRRSVIPASVISIRWKNSKFYPKNLSFHQISVEIILINIRIIHNI